MATDSSQKLEYSALLRRAISDTFIDFIIPNNLLYLIHRYNIRVLTDRDIENVKTCEHNKGSRDANELLLDRLSKYDGWFECLIKVLQDPDVKLPHVAEAMLEKKINKQLLNSKKMVYQRDFTEQEVQVLADFPGWDPNITETQVVQKLTPCLGNDGHFILWYWKTKKRPAISVIDKKQIKTLLVHKKPDPQEQSNVTYYINKNGTSKTNLKEILEYHFKEGVEDMGGDPKGGKISFIKPAK